MMNNSSRGGFSVRFTGVPSSPCRFVTDIRPSLTRCHQAGLQVGTNTTLSRPLTAPAPKKGVANSVPRSLSFGSFFFRPWSSLFDDSRAPPRDVGRRCDRDQITDVFGSLPAGRPLRSTSFDCPYRPGIRSPYDGTRLPDVNLRSRREATNANIFNAYPAAICRAAQLQQQRSCGCSGWSMQGQQQ